MKNDGETRASTKGTISAPGLRRALVEWRRQGGEQGEVPPGRRYRSGCSANPTRGSPRAFAALAGSRSAHGRRVLRHGLAAPEEWQLRFHEPLCDSRNGPGPAAGRASAIRRPGRSPPAACWLVGWRIDPGFLDLRCRPARTTSGLPGDVQRQPAFLPSPQPPAVQCRLPGLAGPPRQAGAAALCLLGAPANILVAIAIRRAWRRGSRNLRPAAGTLAGRRRARRAFLHGALDPAPQAVPGRAELPGAEGPGPRDPAIARLDAGAANFAELALELELRRWQRVPQGVRVDRLDPGSTGRRSRRKPRRPRSSGVLSETLGHR